MSAKRILPLLAAIAFAGHAAAESLYDERSFRPLTADSKAFRVGDVVTVQVVENASASSASDTTTRRTNDISGSVTHPSGKIATADLALAGQFDGGGTTERNGKLVAQLTVTVKEVLPNGDLKIGGEQHLTIDNESQRIYLEGRVRPQDVSDANIVVSTRLADAHIVYLGDGDLSERQRRSWWRRIVDWLGL
jgi:flagellar L-ring protein precursor FlgH